jgi:hypothetical protein
MSMALSVAVLAMAVCGCVERKFHITSEPAGAVVYISDVEVGRTPVTVPFTWYGQYEMILRLDGYETLKPHPNISPPIYEVPPLDLLSALAPWTYHDDHYLHYELQQLDLPEDSELIQRAQEMREKNLEPVRP